jgi:hypothetical protein
MCEPAACVKYGVTYLAKPRGRTRDSLLATALREAEKFFGPGVRMEPETAWHAHKRTDQAPDGSDQYEARILIREILDIPVPVSAEAETASALVLPLTVRVYDLDREGAEYHGEVETSGASVTVTVTGQPADGARVCLEFFDSAEPPAHVYTLPVSTRVLRPGERFGFPLFSAL